MITAVLNGKLKIAQRRDKEGITEGFSNENYFMQA